MMTNPILPVATTEILKLAFNEFIKTSAGEIGKNLTDEALNKARELREKIVSWFNNKDNMKAKKAISAIQEEGSIEAFNKLTTYLDDEMEDEQLFAQDLQQFAQQIINIQSQNSSSRQNINYGRDQFNIEHIHGNPRMGGL